MARQFRDSSEALDFLHQTLDSDTYSPERLARPAGMSPPTEDNGDTIARDVAVPPPPDTTKSIYATQVDLGADAPPTAPAAAARAKKPPAAPGALGSTDSELAALQGFARRRRAGALLGEAGSNFADALTPVGMRTGNGFWDKYGAEGDQAVADYKTRKAADEAQATKAKAAAHEKAFADKTSPESQHARELLRSLGQQVTDDMSAADLTGTFGPWVLEGLKENGAKLRADAAATAKTEEERRKAAALDKDLGSRKEALWTTDGEGLQALGVDRATLNGMSKVAVDQLDEKLKREATKANLNTSQGGANNRAALAQTGANQRAGAALAQGDTHFGKKFGIAEGEAMPNAAFEPDDSAHPRYLNTTEVGKMNNQLAASQRLEAAVIKAKEILARHGGTVPWAKGSKDYGDLLTQMGVIHSQTGTIDGFPSPTDGSVHIAEQMTGGDPRDLANLLNSGRAAAALDATVESAKTAVGISTKNAGYHLRGGAKAPVTKPSPGEGWTRGSVKGRPGWVSPDKTEFEAD